MSTNDNESDKNKSDSIHTLNGVGHW